MLNELWPLRDADNVTVISQEYLKGTKTLLLQFCFVFGPLFRLISDDLGSEAYTHCECETC